MNKVSYILFRRRCLSLLLTGHSLTNSMGCGCLSCESIDGIKQRTRERFCINQKNRSESGKSQKRKEKKNLGWIEDSDSERQKLG